MDLPPHQLRTRRTDPSAAFPPTHCLVVTTSHGVHRWSHLGNNTIFGSDSAGILSAKIVDAEEGLLAVADSRVVILHDFRQGVQRAHRLRTPDEGQVRKLLCDRSTRRVFYTTSLQHAVLSYSFRKSMLLEPGPTHPKPPTVFAISPKFDLLLSASSSPPVIYLASLVITQLPRLLQPSCSECAVTAAAFHPEQGAALALAFADGTLALYAISRLQLGGRHGSYAAIDNLADDGEIGHIEDLHTTAAASLAFNRSSTHPAQRWPSRDGSWTQDDMRSGITAVAFLADPAKHTLVSTGADGRCCIVRFDGLGYHSQGQLLRAWHVGGPAECLAILTRPISDRFAQDGLKQISTIAVGRADGAVMLYSTEGELLVEQSFKGSVRDLDWHILPLGIKSWKSPPRRNSKLSIKARQATRRRPPENPSRPNMLKDNKPQSRVLTAESLMDRFLSETIPPVPARSPARLEPLPQGGLQYFPERPKPPQPTRPSDRLQPPSMHLPLRPPPPLRTGATVEATRPPPKQPAANIARRPSSIARKASTPHVHVRRRIFGHWHHNHSSSSQSTGTIIEWPTMIRPPPRKSSRRHLAPHKSSHKRSGDRSTTVPERNNVKNRSNKANAAPPAGPSRQPRKDDERRQSPKRKVSAHNAPSAGNIDLAILRKVFDEEFGCFRGQIRMDLQEERTWLRDFMAQHVAAAMSLGEENQLLREELAHYRGAEDLV